MRVAGLSGAVSPAAPCRALPGDGCMQCIYRILACLTCVDRSRIERLRRPDSPPSGHPRRSRTARHGTAQRCRWGGYGLPLYGQPALCTACLISTALTTDIYPLFLFFFLTFRTVLLFYIIFPGVRCSSSYSSSYSSRHAAAIWRPPDK